MAFFKRFAGFFKKLQNQPEDIRKIILWSTIIIIGLGFFFFWLRSVKIRLKRFQEEKILESIKGPQFKEELNKMPKIEFPDIETLGLSEEESKKLEELMKGAEEQELEK